MGASAAPISFKEVDLMVRMRVPEKEILSEVSSRKLMGPLDAASEKTLLSSGATAALIQQLKSANHAVSPAEAARLEQMQAQRQDAAARERANDAAAYAARQEQLKQAGTSATGTAFRQMFDGKLVRMENGTLRPYSADDLRNVRYFLLYYSAHWCGPCRRFTPELVKFYKEVKPRHPEIEVIFISSDYNPEGMRDYMKGFAMEWPAVKFEQINAQMRGLGGKGIPWLGIYDAAGQPVTINGQTKIWMNPSAILSVFRQEVDRAPVR
jgi:thiol-disulfide isomerase/thioredoxin